jgi:hypothetical protein
LVEKAAEQPLAEAMLAIWRNQVTFDFGGLQQTGVFLEADPKTAVGNLLNLRFEKADDGCRQ